MGNNNEKPDFNELKKGTNFSTEELKNFFNKFKKDFPDGQINRSQFETLYKKMFGPEGDSKEFCNLVFDQYDKDRSGSINFKEFIVTLSIASRGKDNEKLLWAFQLYDRDGNGQLTYDEIVHVLTAVYKAKNRPNPKQCAEQLAHKLIEAVDDNKDKKISEAEFIHHATKCTEIKELLQTL